MSERANIGSQPTKRSHWPNGFILCTGLAIVFGILLSLLLYITVSGLSDVDSRLTQLEGQQNGVAHIDELSELQKRVGQLSASLQQHSQLAESLRQSVLQTSDWAMQLSTLEKTLSTLAPAQQAQDRRLTELHQAVERLKAAKPSPPVPAADATSATAKTPAKSVSRMPRQAPFVLTGIERRGAGAFAALAPRGYSSLAQIYLLAEGETVSGWMLVQAGQRQAKFRVNGRLITIGVEE